MGNPLIFYGAGDCAKFNYERFINAGLVPVCFADKDESKHHTFFETTYSFSRFAAFAFKIPIFPLKEAIKKYPDFNIYPTQNPTLRPQIIKYLTEQGIERARIRTFEEHGFDYRQGCTQLDTTLFFMADKLSSCCNHRAPTTRFKTDSLTEAIEAHAILRTSILNKLKVGRGISCEHCPDLRFGFYRPQDLQTAIFGGVYKNSYCNLKCVYCGYDSAYLFEKRKTHVSLLETVKLSLDLVPTFKIIQLVSGEPTINPDFDNVMELIKEKELSLFIMTNAVIFKENIARMQENKAVINVSLDSGTRETYHKIKGKDYFEKVLANITKYAQAGGIIELKYIITEGNDNEEEINAFLKIAKATGAKALVSANTLNVRKRLTEEHTNLMEFFITKCFQKDIPCDLVSFAFHPDDFNKIQNFKIKTASLFA